MVAPTRCLGHCGHDPKTGIQSTVDTCEVTFRPLERAWIEHYIDTYQPYDKAGGTEYKMIGFAGVTGMQGSYFTVMGLPTHKLFELINSLNQNFSCFSLGLFNIL